MLRIFRGYAGWSPGQLDAEIDLGAWMVFDALAADVFTGEPSRLWRNVIRRQGGRLAWIADAPDDLKGALERLGRAVLSDPNKGTDRAGR